MASRFQQQSVRRKVIYAVLILLLFFATMVVRRADFVLAMPGSNSQFHVMGLEPKANELALREENRGEVELTGRAVNLLLTGSRGVVVCGLYVNAMEKQKRQQWNELELVVRSVIKLQPHFIEPLLHQGWNLAYNVSVECHDLRDMYFYISRGIELLAEGERRNLHQPNVRGSIALTYQHKICESDKTSTMRSLFQLSCIDPVERNAARFQLRTPDGEVLGPNQAKDYCRLHPDDRDAQRRLTEIERTFEDFCRKHPQLVRRLREGLRGKIPGQWWMQFRCKTPDELVQYLADNSRVPSLYEEPKESAGLEGEQASRPKEPEKRFPLLPPPPTEGVRPVPPQHLFDPSELTYQSELGDEIDAFIVARAWYGYAQEPLPEPDPEQPGASKPIEDRNRQRLPRYTTGIFRTKPASAQSHAADRLEEEGWFDGSGWKITDWFEGDPVVVGRDRNWAAEAWGKANEMWATYGSRCGLLLEPEKLASIEEQAKRFLDARSLKPGEPVPTVRMEDLSADQREGLLANNFMHAYQYCRTQTNFAHHYFASATEMRPRTVTARKHLFEAETFRLAGRNTQAEDTYRKAFAELIDVFKAQPDFRNDQGVQDESYELNLRYVRLVQQRVGVPLRRARVVASHWGQAAGGLLAGVPDCLLVQDYELAPTAPRVPVAGPLDGEINGKPIIPDEVKRMVFARRPADQSLVPALKTPEVPAMGPKEIEMRMRRGGATLPAP